MSDTFDYGWIADVANAVGITDDDLVALSTPGFAGRVMTTYMDRNAAQALYAKKQQFVSTCTSLMKMYQHAVDNSIEPDKATSSTLSVDLIVYLEDLDAADVVDSSTDKRLLTLSSDVLFKVSSYKFYLDYPVNVYSYLVNGVRKYYAQYDMSTTNPVSNVTGAVLSVRKYYYNGANCLAITVALRDTIKYTAEIGYNDSSSGSIFSVEYANNLEHIEAKFRDSATDEYRTLNTAMFFNKSISGETLFYMIKNGTVVFMNKYAGGDFIPTTGGRFKFTLYCTPITSFTSYTGEELTVTMASDDDFEIDFILRGGTTDGSKPPTLEELRTLIQTNKKTLNALISADDVDAYLVANGNSDTMYNTYKYIDNFNDRIYNIVLRLGGVAKIVPTNSVDIYLNETYCDVYGEGRYLVPKMDQKFIAVKDLLDETTVRAISHEQFVADETYKDMNGSISYAIPFQMCYDRKYNFISSFEKIVNTEIETLFSYIDSNADVFVCNSLTYKFNVDEADATDYYTFLFNLSTSDADLIESISADENHVSIYVSLVNSSGVNLCYVKANIVSYDADTQTYACKAFLRMTSPVYSKYIDVKGYDLTKLDDTTEVATTIDLNDAYPRVNVYVKDASVVNSYTRYMNFSGKRLVNVFDIYRDVLDANDGMLFKELSTYLPTQINTKYTKSITTNSYDAISGVVLDKVPVVKYGYYYNNQDNVHSLINSEISILDTIQEKVDGLFKTRMNFVNSYGYSQLVQLGLKARDLGTTHLIPSIKIGLSEDSTLTKDTISSYINAYFAAINFKDGDVFYFSKLSASIKENYSDIIFIELVDINGITSDNQKISMEDPTNVKFISEVINIARDDNDELDIEIEFVYE